MNFILHFLWALCTAARGVLESRPGPGRLAAGPGRLAVGHYLIIPSDRNDITTYSSWQFPQDNKLFVKLLFCNYCRRGFRSGQIMYKSVATVPCAASKMSAYKMLVYEMVISIRHIVHQPLHRNSVLDHKRIPLPCKWMCEFHLNVSLFCGIHCNAELYFERGIRTAIRLGSSPLWLPIEVLNYVVHLLTRKENLLLPVVSASLSLRPLDLHRYDKQFSSIKTWWK